MADQNRGSMTVIMSIRGIQVKSSNSLVRLVWLIEAAPANTLLPIRGQTAHGAWHAPASF